LFLILGGLSAQDEILLSPIETYRRAVALNPNSTQAHLRLGNALRDLIVLAATSPFNPALFTSAESEFKTVLALDPQNKTAVNSLGSLALDKAQANFSKGLSRNNITGHQGFRGWIS
jgi:hypothetical protein